MIHLQSNQRLYISEDLRGYAKKLKGEGTIVNAVDFLQLGFARAVNEELDPAEDFSRHELTDIYTLGSAQIVLEATAQWYARESGFGKLRNSSELLRFICNLGISGGRVLHENWNVRSKSQIRQHIIEMSK
ncbi:MAG: hypothetical protein ABEK75_01050 [Salinibacter sp.]